MTKCLIIHIECNEELKGLYPVQIKEEVSRAIDRFFIDYEVMPAEVFMIPGQGVGIPATNPPHNDTQGI